MDINTVITSIIASGIIGVFISEYYQRKTLVKKMKRDFVIEFFSCRFMLKDDHKGDTTELNKTLGKIPIIFQIINKWLHVMTISSLIIAIKLY